MAVFCIGKPKMSLHTIIDLVEWAAPILFPEPWATRVITITKLVVAIAIACYALYTLWQSWN